MSAPVNVSAILSAARAADLEKQKAVLVEREQPMDLDIGNLYASDSMPLDPVELAKNQSQYISALVRDGVQVLFNAIWNLPTKVVDEAVVATLPPPTLHLPREKPVPKPKPLTRWQKFALKKGITHKKKDRKTWDELTQKFVPRHGIEKKTLENDKNWLIELPTQANPFVDYHAKLDTMKKDRVAKNEKHRLKNLENANPLMKGLTTNQEKRTALMDQLKKTKTSTASLGRFDRKLEEEPKIKSQGKKRQFDPLINSAAEKSRAMSILDKVIGGKPVIDSEKAARLAKPKVIGTKKGGKITKRK